MFDGSTMWKVWVGTHNVGLSLLHAPVVLQAVPAETPILLRTSSNNQEPRAKAIGKTVKCPFYLSQIPTCVLLLEACETAPAKCNPV